MINKEFALTGLGHWVGHCPTNGNVASLILSQGTCLGRGQVPGWGHARSNPSIDVSLAQH